MRGADGRRFVVRRPPLGQVLATAHDMAREHRIITAVGTTGVPVAPTYGLCTDESVNGAPFYVMGFVDGAVLDSPEKAALLPSSPRPAASISDVLGTCSLAFDDRNRGLARREGTRTPLKRW